MCLNPNKLLRKELRVLSKDLHHIARKKGIRGFMNYEKIPHLCIKEAVYSWFKAMAPNTQFSDADVVKILEYILAYPKEESSLDYSVLTSFQEEDLEIDHRRNVANVGYFQRGRDYQWERDDLEPGHWEDHISTPDWRMED